MLDREQNEYTCRTCGHTEMIKTDKCKMCGSKDVVEIPRIIVKNEFPNKVIKGA